jgi:hypothetical protein
LHTGTIEKLWNCAVQSGKTCIFIVLAMKISASQKCCIIIRGRKRTEKLQAANKKSFFFCAANEWRVLIGMKSAIVSKSFVFF